MSKHWRLRIAKLAIPMGLLPLGVWAFRSGPPTGVTGAPGENTCFTGGCHNAPGGEFFPDSQGIQIDFPGGGNYTPGVQQRLRLTVTDAQGQVFGFSLSARDQGNGQAGELASVDAATNVETDAGVQYISHSFQGPREDGTFEFDWTPPANDVGPVTFYVAANAANNNGNRTGDRIHARSFELQPQAGAQPPAIREDQPVLQAFDNSGRISPGTHLQIFGSDLSTVTRQWATEDFDGNTAPTELDGVRVNINGNPAAVSFISPNQINAVAGDGIGQGPAQVQVINQGGTSNAAMVNAAAVSPALQENANFVQNGTKFVVAFTADFQSFIGPEGLVQGANFRPARPGETIVVYALGCGPTTPPTSAGQIPPEVRPVASPFEIRFGQVVAEASGFLVPPFVGLYQFNVVVPNVEGIVTIELTVDGVPTGQELSILVQPEPPA